MIWLFPLALTVGALALVVVLVAGEVAALRRAQRGILDWMAMQEAMNLEMVKFVESQGHFGAAVSAWIKKAEGKP